MCIKSQQTRFRISIGRRSTHHTLNIVSRTAKHSDYAEYAQKRIIEYSEFFVACGYDQQNVRKKMEKVLELAQE